MYALDKIIDNTSRKTVRDVLEDKHPEPQPAHLEAFLRDAKNVDFHPAIFENIIGEVIWAAALNTHGAAGPSRLDALSWR